MYFVTLAKFKRKLGKAELDKTTEIIRTSPKVKVQAIYWTFGRFDAVLIAEAPDEKTYMKFAIQFHDYATTETLLGVPREEAIKLV